MPRAVDFVRRVIGAWSAHRMSNLAGAITFFGILALAPFLLCVVALASVVIQPAQVAQMVEAARRATPPAVTQLIQDQLLNITQTRQVGLLTVGVVLALWSASGAMVSLQEGLEVAFGATRRRSFWRSRAVAMAMTLASAGLLLVAGLIAIASPALAGLVGGAAAWAIHWLRLPLAGLLVMFTWALLYWALPGVDRPFRVLTPGTGVGVVLWLLASLGFSFYVQAFGNYQVTYGALGAVVVLLLWMWISAQVLLLGAEIDAQLDRRGEPAREAQVPGRCLPSPSIARSIAVLAGLAVLRAGLRRAIPRAKSIAR